MPRNLSTEIIPEDAPADATSYHIPLSLDDYDLNNEELRQRRERRRRAKQFSDGVLLMAHPPKEVEDLKEQANARKRPSFVSERLNAAIPTTQDVKEHVIQEHGLISWRYTVLEFLHSKRVQYFLMGLLVLDILILFTEVTLMSLYPFCDIITRDAISCAPVDGGDPVERLLAGGDGKDYAVCYPDTDGAFAPQRDYPVGCDPHKWHTIHTVEDVLFVFTIIILSCFFVELNVLMAVLKPQVFFRQVFYALDYLIIGVSIALELFFKLAQEDLTSSLVGLLVIFRSWRYVRISHGIMQVTAEMADHKFNRLLNYTEHLEDLLRAQELEIPEDPKVALMREKQECQMEAEVRRHHAEVKRQKKEQYPDEQ